MSAVRGFSVIAGLLVAVSLLAAGSARSSDDASESAVSEATIPNFELRDTRGNIVRLSDYADRSAVVVAFLGTECPLSNIYSTRLAELAEDYQPRRVQFLAVNANSQDTLAEVTVHAREHGLTFPVIKDYDAAVADLFAAERTPEVFVLDAERRVRYRGRIDDQFAIGIQRTEPTRRDLAEALDELLDGREVSVPRTDVAGCLIGRPPRTEATADVTYANQVARILQENCQSCHRPGQIAPFALTTYDQAAGWAPMIREVVLERRMPPWFADPNHGEFANDHSLSDAEIETLVAWADAGAPRGNLADLPPPAEFAEGWRLGEPDVVLTMQEPVHVPATGVVDYQYISIDTNFDEDVWVRAVEVRPGNTAVVHHILMFVFPPGEGRPEGFDGGLSFGYFGLAVPGGEPSVFPEGTGKRIPAGARVVFQMHYTPNGTAQTDQSSVGLYLCDQPPQREVRCRGIFNGLFTIPAGDHNHRVRAAYRFDEHVLLTSLFPHMHLRGSSFEYEARYPDGTREVLLSVPRWDFNWQLTYRPVEPLPMPAGTQIVCTAHYDNSPDNPNNPDPERDVGWGEQTWDEMMIGFIEYVPAE